MKITDIVSEIFEWERPGIWNGGHFYGPGRLHKVTVTTDEGITATAGTAALPQRDLWACFQATSITSERCLSEETRWTPVA